MNRFVPRDGWLALHAWLVSGAVHLVILLVGALLLLPVPGGLWDLVTIDAVFEAPDREVTWLAASAAPTADEAAAQPQARDEALDDTLTIDSLTIDSLTIDSLTIDSLTIDSPLAALSRDVHRAYGDRRNAAAGPGEASQSGNASFFGTEALGSRFVYVLDVSPSMNARNGQRLARAVQELLRSIDALYDDQEFYVIVFGYDARLMFDEVGLSPAMVPANLANKQRLREWLGKVSTIPGTDPREALRIGLSIHPHALFLLSDGAFNKRDKPTRLFGLKKESVHHVVEDGNRDGIPVHTVSFEERSSEPSMLRLARFTKGIHQFVPPPAGSSAIKASPSSRASLRASVAEFRFRGE